MTVRAAGLRGTWLAAIALVILCAPGALAQSAFRPIAVVNDSAITGYDLSQRSRILVALGYPPDDEQGLRAEALDQLVTDRLKLQAGKQIGLSPSPELVAGGIELLAQRSKVSADEFLTLMSAQGVDRMAVEDLAGAEAVWIQVIRARFAARVQPGEGEIAAEIELMKQRQSIDYRLQEIGMPLTADGRTEAETRILAQKLSQSLNEGADFDEAVARYSRSPSAAKKGDVGWVSANRLPPDLLDALAELEIGQVSQPLPVPGGVSLLKLVDKRTGTASLTDDAELRDRIRNQLINRKSARLAEGLLQELRRDALIEIR